jgi:hypothetical protein
MMDINYFIENFLMADINKRQYDHFELSYHTLTYPVRDREQQHVICDAIEKMGFYVRVGLAHKYNGRQGLQVVVFEISKKMKFNHKFTDEIIGEIKFAVNS